MTYLDISSNKFDGSIPQSIGKLLNIYTIYLSNNSFNGFIAQSVCQLINLNDLDISSNKLEVIMSIKKGCLLNLWHLNLSHIKISGSIPKNIGHILLSLEYLFLGSNNLNG